MKISNDGLEAIRIGSNLFFDGGVVYSERPVRGHVEFEVEIISYGTSWSGTLKLGVMLHKSQTSLEPCLMPRYTPESVDHCVWCASKLHDHITLMAETLYGENTLDELREGDRLGLLITSDGELHFLINSEPQGRATYGIYRSGYDVYIAVDHFGNCKATRITRASKPVLLSMMSYFLAVA